MNRQELDEEIAKLARAAKLDSWHSFVEELQVPSELFPALASNRAELIKLATPRALTAEETKALYNLVAGLIETNQALRQHASQVAVLVQDWIATVKALISTADKVQRFAQFRHDEVEED